MINIYSSNNYFFVTNWHTQHTHARNKVANIQSFFFLILSSPKSYSLQNKKDMRAAMGNRARTFQWKREGERRAREGKWKNGRRERLRQRLSSFYCILERKNSVMLTCSTQDVRPPRVLFCVVWLNNYHRLGYGGLLRSAGGFIARGYRLH